MLQQKSMADKYNTVTMYSNKPTHVHLTNRYSKNDEVLKNTCNQSTSTEIADTAALIDYSVFADRYSFLFYDNSSTSTCSSYRLFADNPGRATQVHSFATQQE